MITIGADPEFFVGKNGKPISAFDLIPGTKEFPFPVECGAVQVDGMALEFNIDPASEADEFVHNIDTVLMHLRAMVPDDLSFMFQSVAEFGWKYIENQPIDARLLGCIPDFNAYTGKENKPPKVTSPIRTAAGHIHVGWRDPALPSDYKHQEECKLLAKQLDYALGLPSLLVDRDHQRRSMYGKAGAYRTKPYGIEYRVLSNFWLKNRGLKRWVFETTQIAFNMLNDNTFNFWEIYGGLAAYYINNNPPVEEIFAFIENDKTLNRLSQGVLNNA